MIPQPYYMLKFSACACTFEFRVNDVPVLTMSVAGQVSTSLPFNHLILEKGKQNISLKILPLVGAISLEKQAEVSYSVELFDVSSGFVFQNEFNAYKSPAVSSEHLPFIAYEAMFIAEIPYTLNAWQNSTDLTKIKNLKDMVVAEYQALNELLHKKQYDVFQKNIAERETNIATSMYLSPAESQGRVNGLIDDLKNGFEVVPIAANVIMHTYAFGKTVILKTTDGDSALYSHCKETGEDLYIDMMLHLKKGSSKLSVI